MSEQKQELRAYFFQNFYLQGIHAGIQSQHTTAEMFVKYEDEPLCMCFGECNCTDRNEMLFDWARNHKTTIVLSGGMQKDLEEIKELLASNENQYPWSFFHEAEFSLNGALTNVGIILPERIYNAPFISKDFDGDEEFEQYRFEHKLTDFEIEFIKVLKSKRLMN